MTHHSLSGLRVLASGLDHPEGVAIGPDGSIWCGGEAGQIYRVGAAGSVREVANTGGFVLGLCLDEAGLICACSIGDTPAIVRVDPRSGAVERYCASAGGRPLEMPNWPAFAADGTLWFTDSGTEALDVRNGRLIRVAAGGGDGEVIDLEGPLHFPNGMCVDAGGTPYVIETLTPRLTVIRHGRAAVIAELPGHSPDGVALCADGGWLISCYYPFRLLRVPPEGGGFEIVLDDPTGIHMPMPTNVAFFGPDLSELAIACLGGSVLLAIDVGIVGAPLQHPTMSP